MSADKTPKFEMRSVEKLIPYAMNSRTHSDEQIAELASSIREFGFTVPIVVDDDNTILAGHGRLAAARLLNLTEVPVSKVSDWSEVEKKAYVIKENQLALMAGWDNDILKLEFEALEGLGYDVGRLGFPDYELDLIRNGWESDLTFDDSTDSESDESVTIKVKCSGLDSDDVRSTIERAIAESGIDGVTVA